MGTSRHQYWRSVCIVNIVTVLLGFIVTAFFNTNRTDCAYNALSSANFRAMLGRNLPFPIYKAHRLYNTLLLLHKP